MMFFHIPIDQIAQATAEHLHVTVLSVVAAVAVGVPLGMYLTRERALAAPVLGLVGLIQTIPSLALLGFLLPIMGIGVRPAIMALFLYGLLPIVRNTHTAIDSIDPRAIEAASAMGMRELQILRQVTVPQAIPTIMAGVRTATVLSVGIATLCAFIGAGGLGQFIVRGIALVDYDYVFAGAIPAGLLALVLDGVLALVQRSLTPRGRRKRA